MQLYYNYFIPAIYLLNMSTLSAATSATATSAAGDTFHIQQFHRLLQDFCDDLQHGRYDTLSKLSLIDQLTAAFPYLHKEKKLFMERLYQRPATCLTTSLNQYQAYSNEYSSRDFLPPSSNKRKRTEKSKQRKRRRISSAVVVVKNPTSIFT